MLCGGEKTSLGWEPNFILSLYIWERTRGPDPLPHLPMAPDPGIWRHEPRVGGERLVAQPWVAPVPKLFHGVTGGCSDVGPSEQEGTARPTQDGGQLPQVGTAWPREEVTPLERLWLMGSSVKF